MKDQLIPRIIRTKQGKYLGQWVTTVHGKPTPDNIEAWRQKFNASLLPGQANAHLGTAHWLLCSIEVFDQRKKQVLATGTAPMFEAIP